MFCHQPFNIKNPRWPFHGTKYIQVPCGKCLACIQRKARDWNFRLRAEVRNSLNTYFVTLTYNEECRPKDGVSKRDVELFLKKVRENFPYESFRYFLISEYGPTRSHRPHYHGVFMFNDKVYSRIELRNILEKCWPKGFIRVSKITPARIYYCCRYAWKPKTLPKNQNEPFMSCSRRPAIGKCFLTDKLVNQQKQLLEDSVITGGYKVRMPRYYRDKIFTQEEKEIIADKIKNAADEYMENAIAELGYKDVSVRELKNYQLWEKRQLRIFEKKNKRKL